MKKPIHLLLGAAVVLAALAAGLYQGRDLFTGGEHADDGGGRDAPFSAHASQEMLPPDSDIAALQRCLEAREHVAKEVIAGRLTLLEAAARFRAITLARPSHLPVYLAGYPGGSDEERICAQVIAFVECEMEGRPDRSVVVARLKSELKEHLAANGAIVLPEYSVHGAVRSAD